MNTSNPTSDTAWDRILPQIRATRKMRVIRKVATITTLCSVFAIWMGLRLLQTSDHRMPQHMVDVFPHSETPPSTLAVLRVNQDGTARMEEVSIYELEEVQLTLSLEPIITFNHFE
jgi:hypothetical protein